MLGIVFSEFFEMVEENFPDDIYVALLDLAENEFDSKGEYTGVGNYDHNEILSLIGLLSEKTGLDIDSLVIAYGRHLFGQFNTRYKRFFEGVDHSFDFLNGIESNIHSQVRKLYPAAQLPQFECEKPDSKTLIMHYQSERPFAALACGLIDGCIEHFGDNIEYDYEDLSDGEMTRARFELKLVA